MRRLQDEIVGHSEVLQRLMSLIENKKLPSTLILTGPNSVGKFQVALALAQSLFCRQRQGSQPCGLCGDCQRVALQQHEGLRLLKASSGPIKVDDARQVTQFLSLKNEDSEFRLVIIDEAEKMNTQAANALLKTLEEPPANCFIILVTSSLNSLLPTIRSRGQVFRFGGLSGDQLAQIVSVEDWVLAMSGGRLDTIARLQDKDYEQLFSTLYGALNNLNDRNVSSSVQSLQGFIKNKEQCEVLIQSLQSIIRASLLKKLAVTKKGAVALVIEGLANLEVSLQFDLFSEAVRMESYLKSNFDMLLVFETFFASLNQYLKGEEYGDMDRHSYASQHA